MKQILLMVCALLLLGEVHAQERTVSGTVLDNDGETLPGVNVVIKGSTNGTITDLDGKYKLSVPADQPVLVFSFIGMETQEVTIGQRSVVDITMESSVSQLGEVVVIGYGEVDKRKLISSVSSVDGSDIAEMPVASFDQAMQGKAAGVQVTTTSGLIGSAPKIRVRGVNSISSGTSPLYVIDGVPMTTGNLSAFANQNNALADLNPADIASYEILKDGAATAIYGSRAANGVVLITTKSGRKGEVRVNYNFFAGFNETANRFDLLNAEEFIQISNEKFASAGLPPQAFPGDNNVDTDWQDEIFRRGFVQNHGLSVSGGTESVRYYFSLGYSDQEGSTTNNSITRYSTRANVDYSAAKWLTTGVKLQVSNQKNEGLNAGSNSLSGNVFNAVKAFPNVSVYDENHPTGYNLTPDNTLLGAGNNLQNIAQNLTNIRYALDNNQQITNNMRFLGNAYMEFHLPFDIDVRSQIGVDNADTRDFQSLDPLHGDGRGSNGSVFRGYYNTLQWNWQNTVSWRKTLADMHSIYVVAGTEYQKTNYDQFTGSGVDFSDPFFIREGLQTGSFNTQSSAGFTGAEGFSSLFGRVNYDYDNRYLFSASIRQDAISALPVDTREDIFLGGSLGWNIAQESFFNITQVNDLKLRVGWAETGNTAITANSLFPALGTYGPELYGDQTAIAFENVGNADLKWETTTKTNIGLDFGLLNNRISGSVDVFKSETKDLILAAPSPPVLGIPGNTINLNVGQMENRGIEIALNTTNIQNGDFSWTTSFNATMIKNEVTALSNDNSDIISVFNIVRVGEPIGTLYGFRGMGVNPANGNPIYETQDGRLIQGNADDNSYYLYDPENPSELTPTTALSATTDKFLLGQTNPKVYGGLTNSVTFKGFDLNVVLTYAMGQNVFNGTRQNGLTMFFQNNTAEIKNRWTPANPNTNVPRLSLNNDNFYNLSSSLNAGNAQSTWVEKGDYVRIQNISLGYTLPGDLLSSMGLQRLRVYGSVQNPYVFTKYKGLDPELNVSSTSNIISGVDLNTNPLVRTWTLGLNVSF